MTFFFRYILYSLTALSLIFYSGAGIAGEGNVYLSLSGSDDNDGLTAVKPVSSLQRALDVYRSISVNNSNVVKILVSEGVYFKQTAILRGVLSGGGVEIRPLDVNKPRPRFDGGGDGGVWLRVNNIHGTSSRVGVYGLEVVNFETAIWFNGSRDDARKWNGGNVVRNNIFMNIGQISKSGAKPSTAAIRLVNSDGNIISRNKFVDIRNNESCSLLHAIYVAHDSTDNVIEENIFDGGCGDAVRFRDASHRNSVRGNTFREAWNKAPVSDWYCNGESRNDCTKSEGECPSLNNVVDSNKILTRVEGGVPEVLSYGPDLSLGCLKSPSDVRFIVK